MRSLTSITSLLAAGLLCAAPAFAQADPEPQGGPGATPGATPEHGGWLDEGSDPLSPGRSGSPPAAESAEGEPSPAEARRREQLIDRNYSDAQKTYEDILKADPIGPLDRRIANNERIVNEFRGKLEAASRERRQAQVDLYNRTFYLKQQRDKKQITPEVYQSLITQEEEKFARVDESYKRNLASWQKEVDQAQKRLDDLRAQKRLLEAQKPRKREPRRQPKGAAGAAGGPAGSNLVGTLRQRLDHLAHFTTRHTLDGVHPRTLGSPMTVRSAPSPVAEEDGGS
ncbi:MAG: hypothetical protein AB7N76_21010 [Planctomycetota bacterium]